MDKAQGQQKARGRVHFLLQKNTGYDERLKRLCLLMALCLKHIFLRGHIVYR
jgi:hypothetical protein